MATIYFSLSKKFDKGTRMHEVLIRFVVGSRINQRAKTNIFVPAEYWDVSSQTVRVPKPRLMNAEQRQLIESLNGINKSLQDLHAAVMAAFIDAGAGKLQLSRDWLSSTIDQYNFPDKYKKQAPIHYFSDVMDEFLQVQPLSDSRRRAIAVVARMVRRFEAYRGLPIDMNIATSGILQEMECYFRQEYNIAQQHPSLFSQIPELTTEKIIAGNSRSKRKMPIPRERSQNTINDKMKKVREVFLYAIRMQYTTNNPFTSYKIPESVFGTPYYITIEERNLLYTCDLSSHPSLAIQRDIFVFQCVIGCRISDMYAFTRSNLIDGAIEYIPQKTKKERATTVRVPLNSIAREIVKKYEDPERPALLPFISKERYNDAIKEMFLAAGLTRKVTILNPLTRQEEQRPLNEIASSHLARRTFVGNLYKQVKDPNLIAKLSGHSEGSKAFARYRDIDEEMRKDLVKLLEK